MNIPIFCINLERATERKEKIQKLWIDELGFNITFWKAWDRRDIENNKLYYSYDSKKSLKIIGRKLSSGELACITSHCMIHEHCLNNKISEYIIIEDDISPSEQCKTYSDLEEKINFSKNEFVDASIFLLFKPHNKFDINIRKKHFSSLLTTPWGAQFVYYTNNISQKIFSGLSEFECPVDHWAKIKTLDVKKDIIISNIAMGEHGNDKNTTTYIGNGKRRFIC